MSTLLWKYYFENDVDNFRQVLARATCNASAQSARAGAKEGHGSHIGSPGAALATSPTLTSKSPRQPNSNIWKSPACDAPTKSSATLALGRADINWKDSQGLTLLHYIASSTNENASDFALALLRLPILDLYTQDEENGWTALHRALYFGNITIARALMDRDIQDAVEHSSAASTHVANGLIKIKDREGNSPFDVYGAAITSRSIRQNLAIPLLGGNQDEDDNEMAHGVTGDANEDNDYRQSVAPTVHIEGDEVFAFGSNKNFTLGFGDEDDRQFPEKIQLKRPDHLLRRLYREHQSKESQDQVSQHLKRPRSPSSRDQLPAAVQYRPIIIQDVQLSKLHSAVLTTDPEANLYMCGFGSGGRLGMGDETTRFGFANVHGGGLMGKKVIHVGLGQNHTIAISCEGETFTWGNNAYGQLGYAPNSQGFKDEDPLQLLPRQVFGPLKRELVVGAAASRIHSVVHTASSLYTFGKNEGQLGLVDSDARSLAMQSTPRKVAASLFGWPVHSVSAIDKATICLLENSEVWVFSNFGYTKISFPWEGFSNYFLKSNWGSRNSRTANQICKITSGGDTICALSSTGDVFTVHVTQKIEPSVATASTTNPSKIRGALSAPQRVWSLKKGHMAVWDVDVSQDGSIITCTKSGSVWRRVKRAKIKDASATGVTEYKAKDYKFCRVPGLTRISAVRSSTFGAYAAVRCDFGILKSQIEVESKDIWKHMYPLLPLHGLADENSDTENPTPRFWTSQQNDDVASIRRAVLTSDDIEQDVADFLDEGSSSRRSKGDTRIGTTLSEVYIPVHDFVLEARSEIMRQALMTFRKDYFFTVPDLVTIEYDGDGQTLILFQGIDFITLLNFVLYIYTDSVADVWNHTRHAPELAPIYRQIRTELMRIASHFHMHQLERAIRVMQEPPKTLDKDFGKAIGQPGFFDNGDIEVELDGQSMKVHSPMMVQRCPFFEGLFEGRSAGFWLSSRREAMQEHQDVVKVDLKHVEPYVFRFVLQHLYADTDEEIFDGVATSDLDTYLDLIMDVMSVANELMLDRLAQCCQKVLGRYVNIRNVCQLLNAVAPCSVTQFKDAALEYICLNLEGMLENRLLGELDEDLMLELDEVVRENQLTCLPIAKSGRADAELIERYPQLLDSIERSKRTKVDSVALQIHLHEREARATGGSKAKAAFLEDFDHASSAPKPKSRPSRARNNQSKSPALKPKRSVGDLMFEMDEDSEQDNDKPEKNTPSKLRSTAFRNETSPQLLGLDASAEVQDYEEALPATKAAASSPSSYQAQGENHSLKPITADSKRPWALLPSAVSKLDMRDIMAQDSSSRGLSRISASLSGAKDDIGPTPGLPIKLSQRQRKLQQQQQQSQESKIEPPPTASSTIEEDPTPVSPWQIASRGPKVSLKDVLGRESVSSPPAKPSVARTPSPMTLRQTVSGKAPARRAVTGPAQSPLHTQKRSLSTPNVPKPAAQTPPQPSRSSSNQTPIQLIRHTAPSVEPTLQLSMADILSQQQTEKEIIKEAAAKRSLQEIQEEQAFQEWWDEESRKVRAEEQEAAAKPATRGGQGARGKVRGGNRDRGRGRGRGGADCGEGSSIGQGGRKADEKSTGGSRGGKKGGSGVRRGRKAADEDR